jgi:hypothetical protein
MTPNVYRKLIATGGRKEVNLHFESRAAIIMKREEELSQEIADAVADQDFDRAHELQGVYDELEALKKRFPDLKTLKQESDSISYDIEKAIIEKDWICVRDIQAVLVQVQRKIQVEKDALLAFGIMDTHDDENDILKTRTCIDAKLEELTLALNKAADVNDFKKAAEIDVDLQRLEELKPLRPTKAELFSLVSKLEAELAEAKTRRNWEAAKTIFCRLEGVKAQVDLEKKAEQTMMGLDDANNQLIVAGNRSAEERRSISEQKARTTPRVSGEEGN